MRGLAWQARCGSLRHGRVWLGKFRSGLAWQGGFKVTQYIWKSGGFRVKPQVAGERLAALHEQNGHRLTPRIVLDDARPEESPLHPCFEWDDTRAAELHREDQARNIIRSIRVSQQTSEKESRVVRAYVNIVEQVGKDIQHAYVPMATVMGDEAMRLQLLARARRDLMAFKERYDEFEELAAVAEVALQHLEQLEPKASNAA